MISLSWKAKPSLLCPFSKVMQTDYDLGLHTWWFWLNWYTFWSLVTLLYTSLSLYNKNSFIRRRRRKTKPVVKEVPQEMRNNSPYFLVFPALLKSLLYNLFFNQRNKSKINFYCGLDPTLFGLFFCSIDLGQTCCFG